MRPRRPTCRRSGVGERLRSGPRRRPNRPGATGRHRRRRAGRAAGRRRPSPRLGDPARQVLGHLGRQARLRERRPPRGRARMRAVRRQLEELSREVTLPAKLDAIGRGQARRPGRAGARVRRRAWPHPAPRGARRETPPRPRRTRRAGRRPRDGRASPQRHAPAVAVAAVTPAAGAAASLADLMGPLVSLSPSPSELTSATSTRIGTSSVPAPRRR